MDPFYIKLILSFLVGGLYIGSTIWVAERFGSKIGGILIGLPATLLVGLLFIAWTQNIEAAVSATVVAPAAIAANSLFLVAFIALHKHGRFMALTGSMLLWALLTLPLVLFTLDSLWWSILISALFFGLAIRYLRKFPHQKLPGFHLPRSEFLFRVVFTGFVVFLAVLLGKILGPLWGGLFVSFPAAFSSSLFLLERTHGIDFTASVAKTMPYGSIGNVLFASIFYLAVPYLGLLLGTLIAYFFALLFGLIIYKVGTPTLIRSSIHTPPVT